MLEEKEILDEPVSLFKASDFKNASGKLLTKGLFYELSYSEPENCVFTLKDEDITVNGKRLYSLKKLYLALVLNDPTEYTFAQTVFTEWRIWERVKSSPTIVPFYTEWLQESEVKIRSRAIKQIALEAADPSNKNSFQAAKLLLARGWLDEQSPTAQRLKAKEEEEKRITNEALDSLSEDAERLGLTIN